MNPTATEPGAHHLRCRHRRYYMTCEEFDALYGDGICQICGADEAWTRSLLYIDHVGGAPNWQVRGLLCLRCNSKLQDGQPFNAVARSYVEKSYWLTQLMPLVPTAEPESGFARFRWRKAWHRRDDGWHRSNFCKVDYSDRPWTWEQLCMLDGPPTQDAGAH